ncbi:TlpA family protein disulfide reductase [Mucilaginibacter terrae]|uniref:Thiol-disulfide isomerase/thioredoxin n=1 Tax=Mucilaginibacter terrae TaxID=1955052 RepID=A0ABU3GWI1_9SPHI|nr:TlpA disulfide reductase family protein [Mucilaginibacter terrae]MDT3404124.1 thiol-disulfide isomerase/thioredoxin [Mucilaginibacter terrae]
MKKLITILFTLCASFALLLKPGKTMAQFKLSGTVAHLKKADTIDLNIPYVYGYYNENIRHIPLNKQGTFTTNIELSATKFATLTYHGRLWTIMMKPGKQLEVTINATDTTVTAFKGSVAAENKVLHEVNAGQRPAFIAAGARGKNSYAKGTVAEITEKVIKPQLALGETRVAQVQASTLNTADKRLIAQETRTETLNWLNFLVRGIMNINKTDLMGLYKLLYSNIKPEPEVLPAGPQFYQFADDYIGYMESQAVIFMQGLDKDKANTTPLPYFNVSFDDAITLSKSKGKLYVNWLAVKNNYSKPVAEVMLAQFITAKCAERDLTEARPLMDEMISLYPQSKYRAQLSARIANMESALVTNKSNEAIHIVEGYKKINSIYEIVNQYKGKVVYLDVWGTWCGPCRDELRFVPELKKQFEGKDVVFVYLDMDDDIKEAHWREFIKVNNMTGIHLRKSNADIQKFWDELQPDKNKQGSYPTYFIFDKSGKPVINNIKRPSDKMLLYQQIAQYL